MKASNNTVKIKEQTINDEATGLTLVFRIAGNGETRLHLIGSILPFGNRDFSFDKDGEPVGKGTGLIENCVSLG